VREARTQFSSLPDPPLMTDQNNKATSKWLDDLHLCVIIEIQQWLHLGVILSLSVVRRKKISTPFFLLNLYLYVYMEVLRLPALGTLSPTLYTDSVTR
jgi:hypothetical protein